MNFWKNIKIWKNIETCPAWNYYKAIETDVRFLIRKVDIDELPKVKEKHLMQLNEQLSELSMQAAQYEIESVRRNEIIFDLTKKIEVMTADYVYIVALLEYVKIKGGDEKTQETLKNLGFAFRDEFSLDENVRRLKSRNENNLIKINERRDELKAMINIKEKKKDAPIEKSLVLVEKHYNRDIDLKKISVKKWLTMKNQVLEDIKRSQKNK